MACLGRSVFSQALVLRPTVHRRPANGISARTPVRCSLPGDNEKGSNKEEAPESLFMKELKKRGMNPTSILEESKTGVYEAGENEADIEEEIGGGSKSRGRSKRNGVASADYERSFTDQRKESMALNSEGLEGLIPRAKLLLTLGGTFFLAFGPLILTTVASFSALYFFFGPSFVHDARSIHVSPPRYIDPYELLQDERLSQVAPPPSQMD